MLDYTKLLEDGYAQNKDIAQSRCAFLSVFIFGFTTYDHEMNSEFGMRAVEVCKAISERTTFEYIAEPEQYKWYLIMCNTPFFMDRIEWGTSIRGAWWNTSSFLELDSCGMYDGDVQITNTLSFNEEEWSLFIRAVVEFAAQEN